MNSTKNSKKIYEALVLIVVLAFICSSANGETFYAQSVLHEIGDWVNVTDLIGPPDGQYAYTANVDTTPWGKISSGAGVWIDFGRTVHGGTIVVYHNDPGGHSTGLGATWSWSGYAGGAYTPSSSDGRSKVNIQGTGVVKWCFPARDFRYVRLNHFTSDTALQDGIDAVAVIEGDPAECGLFLDPAPPVTGAPIHGVSQWNNGYWSNPAAILGEADGIYAWSQNPQHTSPRIIVDVGRVVYSGNILLHHDKSHPLYTSLGIFINSEGFDPDPDTCPDPTGSVWEEWEYLSGGSHSTGIATLQFPPTRFRYILLSQGQHYPGQEDGIDAVEVYETEPELPVEPLPASYHSQDETNWCALASLAMLLSQYGCRANYETHSEPVKPWDVASYMGWPPEFGIHAFLANVFPKLNPNFLEPEFGLTLKVLEYRPWLSADELDLFWGDLESVLESGKLAMLGLSTLRHAVVISGHDEYYVYVNDPNPYGSKLYEAVMGTIPDYSEAHMFKLPKEDLSKYLSSEAISLYWLEGEDPAITSGRATIWLGGENSRSLRFVDPGNIVEGVAKVTLELAWNGKKPFGYMYSKVPQKKGGSGVPRIRNNELEWAALPSEALRLWAAVANPEAQERKFTVVMTITRISDRSLCFQKESEPFPIRGKSRAFETWRLVPLVEPDDGLILTDYLPIEDLRGSAESAVGEYLLRLELRSSSGMENWVYIRFNVAERPGHKATMLWPGSSANGEIAEPEFDSPVAEEVVTDLDEAIDLAFYEWIEAEEAAASMPLPDSPSTDADDNSAVPEEDVTGPDEDAEVTDDDPTDTGDDEWIVVEEAAVFTLFDAAEAINELSIENFSNEDVAIVLINEIDIVLAMIDEGMYAEGRDKLQNDILERTNGFAEVGESDQNDWIRTYEGQGLVYPLIVEAIELLEIFI